VKLSPVVVPFLTLSLACASAPSHRTGVPGSYAIYIDNRVADQPVTGGFGRATGIALYQLHGSLRSNLEKITYVREEPVGATPYDAVIIITPMGDSTLPVDSFDRAVDRNMMSAGNPTSGSLVMNYVVRKSGAPDQPGIITYDFAHGTLSGFRELLQRAVVTPVPSAGSTDAR
jgi:hypothetical protein